MSRIPHTRFLIFLVVFMAISAAMAIRLPAEAAVILGFDLAALVFLASTVPLWRSEKAQTARDRAARDDGGRVLLLLASVAVLTTILLALVRLVGTKTLTGASVAAIAGTLILAWMFAHMAFAFHYSHLYYDNVDGKDARGIAFPDGQEPVFSDFVYFAFTIGMTSQTADLAIVSRVIRRTATAQGLFAFFFNLGVLALMVNVVAGIL